MHLLICSCIYCTGYICMVSKSECKVPDNCEQTTYPEFLQSLLRGMKLLGLIIGLLKNMVRFSAHKNFRSTRISHSQLFQTSVYQYLLLWGLSVIYWLVLRSVFFQLNHLFVFQCNLSKYCLLHLFP